MDRLRNKRVLITGGGSGIGLASARLFAQEGAQVIITGRDADTLARAAAAIGPAVTAIPADVSRLDDLDRLYGEVGRRFGRLDVLFANAGVGALVPFEAVTEAEFDRQFGINVRGLFFTVQKALPHLNDGASVILNASIAHSLGMPAMSVYSATKAAVRSFARTWTSELKDRRIRVNSLSPGPTQTPITGKMGLPAEQLDAMMQSIQTQVPMGRFASADEQATAALFLATDDSSFVTGIDLSVDGGMAQV